MQNILVIRSSAMGDVAMTAPILRAVMRKYPHVNIIMLTRDFYEPFFFDIPNLTVHNIDLSELHSGVNGVYKLFKELQLTYKIDFIIDLNDKLYSKLLRCFFRWAGIHSVHIDKGRKDKKALTRKSNKIHQQLRTSIERYADVFSHANLFVEVEKNYSKATRALPEPFHQYPKMIGLAPFAKHKGKILPLETVRNLLTLIETNLPQYKVVIFGGGSYERNIADSLVAWHPNAVSAISKIVLAQEIDLMANLELLISMDSSAMHIASLVGTPVISVWGATHPHAGFLGWGQSIENAVCKNLDCQPCSVYGHKPCYRNDYKCLTDISAQDIFNKISHLVQDTSVDSASSSAQL